MVLTLGTEGIIPAYAGNTARALDLGLGRRDHPRVCGEHNASFGITNFPTGSSPRMRGTHARFLIVENGFGIIPAYAGNTQWDCLRPVSAWDHPRVCGEHVRSSTCPEEYRGSSPRMRGTLPLPSRRIYGGGIIPAYAGNTRCTRAGHASTRDHPRVCGEHCARWCRAWTRWGSSPRMRGTPPSRLWRDCRAGIIPAYAGNTPCIRPYCEMNGDHPRVCGEHCDVEALLVVCVGSSPRMRGTL